MDRRSFFGVIAGLVVGTIAPPAKAATKPSFFIGHRYRAVMPNDDVMIFGCDHAIWRYYPATANVPTVWRIPS